MFTLISDENSAFVATDRPASWDITYAAMMVRFFWEERCVETFLLENVCSPKFNTCKNITSQHNIPKFNLT